MRGDFHIHTMGSDGALSAKEIVNLAKKQNVQVIAITDHDTVASVDEAIKEGERIGIKVIPGVELSTTYNGETVHLLCYFKDGRYKDEGLINLLATLENHRIGRGGEMIKNLKKFFNIELDYEKIVRESTGVIARPHIAKAIIEAGYDYTWDEIFHNLLNEGSPAFVPNFKVPTEEGIKFLKSIGGLTILAHPVLIKKTSIDKFISMGVEGLEAIYPLNTEEDTEYFEKLCKESGLVYTAGSDYHGVSTDDGDHGDTIGAVNLYGKELEEFLNKLN